MPEFPEVSDPLLTDLTPMRSSPSTCAACAAGASEGSMARFMKADLAHQTGIHSFFEWAPSSGAADIMFNVENKTTQTTEAVSVETVVRCTEIDVNGHLNNAKFVEYLEWGREEWYESHGFGYDHLEEMGAITVVVNVNLNYRRPCHQGDRLRIVTSPQRRGHSSFALAQRIERSDGTVVADGVVTIVTVDSDTRHAVPLPEEFAGLFRAAD